MTVHEFGNRNNPVIVLLSGTMCYWRGNFGGVIEDLAKDFLVVVVAYTGFDESDNESYSTVNDELEKIERYVKEHYDNKILMAYGSSLGGTFVAHLVARHNVSMRYGIIGSSDMEQAGNLKATLMARLMVRLTYNFIHTGCYSSKLMQRRYARQMASPDPYNKAFVSIVGRDKYDMSFITKESMFNQFKSDITTPLPEKIDNGETEVHIFYANKMGEKYLKRYEKYFKSPIIHEHSMRHEELLGVHPDEWCKLVREVCKVQT